MPKNLNSATRLFKILEQVPSHTDNTQSLEVWATIFRLDESSPRKRVVAVGEVIHAMHRELDFAADGLSTANFSKSLYEGAFSRIENALSPMLFPSTWNQVKQYITPDTLTALAFCSEILPNEEFEITEEEVQSIREKVGDLRATLSDATIPDRLRSLIQHHIELIERALFEYPISGAKALREAGRTALGEMIEVKDDIAIAKGEPAVEALGSLWKSVNKAADYALKSEGLVQLGQKAWEALGGFF